MPAESDASAIRRRNAIGLVTSAVCHGLLVGLGALFLSGPVEKPAAAETLVVDLVEALPTPIREVSPDREETQPAPAKQDRPKTFTARPYAKPQPRAQAFAPMAAVSPSTEVATADEMSLPTAVPAVPHKETTAPATLSSSGPVPQPTSGPGPITVQAAPRYRDNPRPDYPIGSRRRHEEGEVRVAVTVTPEGHPLRVLLAKTSGHPLLDQAAVDAVRTWTFEPARASGVAVTSEVIVPVRFSLGQE